MSDKKYTPILPFEDSMTDGFVIYDNVKYVRDIELAEDRFIMMHNPNMIKYYTTLDAEPVKIGGD